MKGKQKRSLILTELPFVGRAGELDQIAEFSNNASDEEGLSILWITGEAGIGKSSLLRQATGLIRETRSVPIHVCLFPSSTESIVQLLADAINADPQVSGLLTKAVARILSSVLEALHRLTRLRRIVLILEDLHLLTDQSRQEFETLMEALAETAVGVICVSRPDPSTSNAYRILLPYLVDTIELSPLSFANVKKLLDELKLLNAEVNLTGYVHRATRGNPFILRAIVSELHLVPFEAMRENRSFASLLISEKAAIAIESYVQSLYGQLTAEEKNALNSLTLLGELFSLEAASRLFGNTERMLERLSELGLITKSLRATMPLIGETSSAFPYVFTHSLLYNTLEKIAVYTEQQIEQLLSSEAALYSIVPFRKLADIEIASHDGESTLRTVYLLVDSFHQLGWLRVSSRASSLFIVKEIEKYIERREAFLSPEQMEELETEVLSVRMFASSHVWADEKRVSEMEKYVRLSSNPKSARHASHYCKAIFELMADVIPSEARLNEEFDRVRGLGSQFPEIVPTIHYIKVVGQIMGCTQTWESFARIRSYYLSVLEEITDPAMLHVIHHAKLRMLHKWIQLMESEEELSEYLSLRDAIEEHATDNIRDARSEYFYPILHSYSITGRALEAYRIVSSEIERLHDASEHLYILLAKRLKMNLEFKLGLPLDELERALITIIRSDHGEYSFDDAEKPVPKIISALAMEFITQGVRRGNVAWGERVAKSILPNIDDFQGDEIRFLRALFVEDRDQLQAIAEKEPDLEEFNAYILGCALSAVDRWSPEVRGKFIGLLQNEIATPRLLTRVHNVLHLLEYRSQKWTDTAQFAEYLEHAPGAVCRAIDWCLKNDLVGWAEPFLRYAGNLLEPDLHATYREKVERARSEVLAGMSLHESPLLTTDRTHLTMIGSLTVAVGEAEGKNIRGSRLRHVLGMMVANQTLRVPLTLREFSELATGMDPEDSAVRMRNYLHTILSRIRELVGHDAVVTDGRSAPRLNPDVVSVDILNVLHLKQECASFIRRSVPRRATLLAQEILDLVGAWEFYPTLEEDFFQAARDDFEIEVRRTLLSVARLLQQEGDLEEAEILLRRVNETLPDDDEVLQELVVVLKLMGRSAESTLFSRQADRHI